MFRDTKEELDRLEAELLEDEIPEAETEETQEDIEEKELLGEEELDALLSDDQKFGSSDGADIYKNYSNGYRAYNSDSTDLSADELSEELTETRRDPVVVGLTALALILVAAIMGVLAWILLTFRGVL